MKIAESNFRLPEPLDPNAPVVGDKGFFGRGIYFTQVSIATGLVRWLKSRG
jgi:hypothetical protein